MHIDTTWGERTARPFTYTRNSGLKIAADIALADNEASLHSIESMVITAFQELNQLTNKEKSQDGE